MSSFIESLSFGTPLALLGLLALPAIWWLLRFTPPRPQTVKFPPIRILLGLPPQDQTHDRTPLWLLLLRLALAAILALAVAQPFLQPKGTAVLRPGHRLVIIDDGWAAADNWDKRQKTLIDILENARSEASPVSLVGTTAKTLSLKPEGENARDVIDTARLLKPSALTTDRMAVLRNLETAKLDDVVSIVWLSDGLDSNAATAFAQGLSKIAPRAELRILAPEASELPLALGAMTITGSDVNTTALRPEGTATSNPTLVVKAINGRTLLEQPINFGTSNEQATSFSLPTALRNEIQSLAIIDQDHAGARQLFDDRWRKRTVALQSSESAEQSEAQPLLSLLHYVRRGLEPFAELYEPQSDVELANLLDGGLSMLVQADVGEISESSRAKLAPWLERGGILLRFAGPRLAAAHDELLPVTLRTGDRTLGSALSWDVPQGLQEFQADSIFAGLRIDPAIKVTRQVLAEPDADLASRTWASLDDGTPLVTAQRRGKGLVILFHVTANASWSNLPLSGLFLEMLQRVAGLDPTIAPQSNAQSETAYQPRMMLTGTGELISADGTASPIPATEIDKVIASSLNPPGLYVRQGRERALNLSLEASDLTPMPPRLAGVAVSPYVEQPRESLAPLLFMLAAVLFTIDSIAAIMLGGGLKRSRHVAATLATVLVFTTPLPDTAMAQDNSGSTSDFDTDAALNTRLAYVTTGDADIDRTSKQGLFGLTVFLTDRTSASLAEPVAIDIERDDPVFYPMLYWPVADNAQAMTEATRKKVANYLKNGGTIFFDTRNGGIDSGTAGGDTPLQKLLQGLDLPPLEPVPDDHVLTRSFYLLDRFPGRFDEARLWVEAGASETGSNPGTADGVSSIIIGANDYAAAWAIDDAGQPLYAVVPGTDRQREFAMRTGINIVMYALTGNYKADQVHVPALLERLGQ